MLDVYKSFYKLESQPFRLSPDYRFTFGHRTYDEAMAYLKYSISEGEGFVAITGAPGTGKTTLIETLLTDIDDSLIKVATLTNTALDTRVLVERVLDAYGMHPGSLANVNPLALLIQFLRKQSQHGGRTVLIVDEAQTLAESALEELRILSNLQHNNQLLLQILLVGQESLMDVIRSPGMEQLQQRLIAASRLEPLELDETRAYIEYRLHKVGWKQDPSFSDETIGLIHKFSGGVPRRINLICHRLFLRGGIENKHEFHGKDALTVIVELHKEGLLPSAASSALA